MQEQSWSCESLPAVALRCMWLGEGEAPTHHLVQSLFAGPWGKSEQHTVEAGANTRVGG